MCRTGSDGDESEVVLNSAIVQSRMQRDFLGAIWIPEYLNCHRSGRNEFKYRVFE